MIAIETKDLFKSLGTKMAVKGIDLCVNEGELFALLGAVSYTHLTSKAFW